MANREEISKKINAELEQLIAGGFYARSKNPNDFLPKVGDVKPNVEDKNYKAHEDAIKKIPPITIIPIPMIPITQPIK